MKNFIFGVINLLMIHVMLNEYSLMVLFVVRLTILVEMNLPFLSTCTVSSLIM